jgi:hypothetical protein
MKTNLIYIFLNANFLKNTNATNTNFVYTTLPDYYLKTFEFNKPKFTDSYFLTEENIIPIINDTLFKTVQELIDRKWSHYKEDLFWYNTFIRQIIVAIFVIQNNLTNVIHIEADNIIFADDITSLVNILNDDEFAYSSQGDYAAAPSPLVLKDVNAALKFINVHIKLLDRGERELQPHVGYFYSKIMDMAFLDLIKRGNIPNFTPLPCLPYGINSINFDALGYLFDPGSYGQFLGGTNNGDGPGFIDPKHYVGKELMQKRIDVIFDQKPYIIYQNQNIPIFNLHVHNKKAINQFLN